MRTRALEDGATALRHPWSGGRGGIDGARAGLRHDDAAGGWSRRCGDGGFGRCFRWLVCRYCGDGRRGSWELDGAGAATAGAGAACASTAGAAGAAGLAAGGTATTGGVAAAGGSGCDGWARDDRADGRLAGDGRRGWRSDDVGLLTRQRNDAAGLHGGRGLRRGRCCSWPERLRRPWARRERRPRRRPVAPQRLRWGAEARLWRRLRPVCARGWP